MARLIVYGPGDSSRRVEVARGVFRIGRALDNDLLLDADGVSDHHALLTRGESGYVLSGTPASGTLINDVPAADAPLHTGDEIRLGSARLVFEYDEGDPTPQASQVRPRDRPCVGQGALPEPLRAPLRESHRRLGRIGGRCQGDPRAQEEHLDAGVLHIEHAIARELGPGIQNPLPGLPGLAAVEQRLPGRDQVATCSEW
jgi:hypothetical protein